MPNEKLFAQARDELFSHINRCGVLNATEEDKSVWMDETIDYLGERYPELAKPDLTELHSVGIRFCQPAINNVPTQTAVADPPADEAEAAGATEDSSNEAPEGSADAATLGAKASADEGDATGTA